LAFSAAREALSTKAGAIDFVRDGFGHLKIIGHTAGGAALFEAAGIAPGQDDG
jgi:hypothetical protein